MVEYCKMCGTKLHGGENRCPFCHNPIRKQGSKNQYKKPAQNNKPNQLTGKPEKIEVAWEGFEKQTYSQKPPKQAQQPPPQQQYPYPQYQYPQYYAPQYQYHPYYYQPYYQSYYQQPYPYPPPAHYYPYQQYPQYQYGYYPYSYKRPMDTLRNLATIVVAPSHIFLVAILFINLIMLFFGINVVLDNIPQNIATIAMIYPWPNYLYLINLEGSVLTFWYLFLVAAIAISGFWLIKTEGKEFVNIFVKSLKRFNPPPSKSDNSFVIIGQLFFALIFFNIIVVLFFSLWGFGQPSTEGETPKLWELFFDLANASVAEEIFTRTIYIGIPLLIYHYIAQKPKNKLYRYFIGGGFEFEPAVIVLIIFSAVLFGLAHLPSWGLWKFFPTFTAGLAFGYLFVKKGIHTAIILHFLVDYMAILPFLANNYAWLLFIGLMFLVMWGAWFFSGIIYFGLYFIRIKDFFSQKFLSPVPKPDASATYGLPGYGLSPHEAPPGGGSPFYPYYSTPSSYDYQQRPPTDEKVERPSTKVEVKICQTCKNELTYVPYYDNYYCYRCEEYQNK